MTRTEHDTWDLASSVGATATAVAAARAIAGRAEPPLIDDPYAEPLVRAVGIDLFTALAAGEVSPADLGDDGPMSMTRMTDNMAVRTRFFDDFFTSATGSGIRQAVILASGLDTRAYRLPWPPGTVVFEIDQPAVIEFKTRTLADLGVSPGTDRRTVPIDLRDDWPAALRGAGFDPARATAWSAEGLLAYLPPEAQDRLLDTVTELSAPGSRIATESMRNMTDDEEQRARQRMRDSAERMQHHGLHLDLSGLIYFGDRNEAADYLATKGWRVSSRSAGDLLVEHGLDPLPEDDDFAGLAYVTGMLG